eukprot:Hpha_TRINITY_DN15296_c3_g7::TRINITY_DN15296_c3_g7_i1::g.66245::m.66245/K04371/MAPK1_3; mitogen-activated protein kinase 1/3
MPTDVEILKSSLKAASGEYKFERVLGNGSYGDVVQAKVQKTGELVAAKRVKEDVLLDELLARRMYREILVMQHLHWTVVGEHRAAHFACLRDILLVPDEEEFHSFWMIMDLCDCDLRFIVGQGRRPGLGCIELPQVRYIVFQLLHALKTMKDAHIIHRDIQAANVLINCDTLDAKVCDFGMAKEHIYGVQMNYLVTMQWYRAPELLLKSPYYDYQVDLWGVGCILGDLIALHGLGSQAKEVSPLIKCQPPTDLEASIGALVSVLGAPSKYDLSLAAHPTIEGHRYEPSSKVIKIVKKKSANGAKHVNWCTHLGVSDASPDAKAALVLLDRMLVYHPFKRITVEEALASDWFSDLRFQYTEMETEYTGTVPRFRLKANLDLDDVDDIRGRIYKEAKRVQAEKTKRKSRMMERGPQKRVSVVHQPVHLPVPQHPGNYSFGPMTVGREPGAPVDIAHMRGAQDVADECLKSADMDPAGESTRSDISGAHSGALAHSGPIANTSFANTSFYAPPSPCTRLLAVISSHLDKPVEEGRLLHSVEDFYGQDGLPQSAKNILLEAGFSPRAGKFRKKMRDDDWKNLAITLRQERRGEKDGATCWPAPQNLKPLRKPPVAERTEIAQQQSSKSDSKGCCGDSSCTVA